jgi:hypothetical protein
MSFEQVSQQPAESETSRAFGEYPIKAPIADVVDMDLATLAGTEFSDDVTGLINNQTTTAGSQGS